MATLIGTGRLGPYQKPINKRFTVTPVLPGPDGPKDAYDVEFGPDWEGKTVRIRGNVHGWQLGHSYFECIAEMFCGGEILLAFKETRHALEDTMSVSAARSSLKVGLDWLTIIIYDASSPRNPDQLGVEIFIADPAYTPQVEAGQVPSPQSNRFIVWGMYTTLTQAAKFGDELLLEMTGARQRRLELGLLTDEDMAVLAD